MMEGLSGISLGTWGQGEPGGWALIKKPDATGLLSAWCARQPYEEIRKSSRNPPGDRETSFSDDI